MYCKISKKKKSVSYEGYKIAVIYLYRISILEILNNYCQISFKLFVLLKIMFLFHSDVMDKLLKYYLEFRLVWVGGKNIWGYNFESSYIFM